MALGKYCRVGDAIKTITGEHCRVGDAIKLGTINAPRIADDIKEISLADRYFYTAESQNDELYRGTAAGAEDWHYDLADATIVAVNSSGESYWGVGVDVVKLNADGTLAWTWSRYGVLVTSLAVENRSGIIYVYYGSIDGGVVCLVDTVVGPGEVWAVNVDATYGPPIYALAVDTANGLIYAGASFYAASKGVWRASVSTGTFVKRYASANDITALAVDTNSPASVYCGDDAGNYRKLSAEGYVYWTKTLTGTIVTIEIAHNGYGYLSCESEKKVYKFTPATGVEIWNYAPVPATSAYAYQIAVDSGGNVYACYRYLGGNAGNLIYKISKDGAFVWSWQSYVAVKFYGMAVTPGLEAGGF